MIRVYVGATALKSASGFCAGVLPQYCEKVAKDACGTQTVGLSRSRVWTICGTPCYSGTSAAYGKWMLRWDSSIANRVQNGRITFGQPDVYGNDECRCYATGGFVPLGFKATVPYYVQDGYDLDGNQVDLRDLSESEAVRD